MNFQKLINDDYAYWLLASGLTAIYAVGRTVLTERYFDEGWLHPLLIVGIISGLFCIGLAMGKEWSRWIGVCFFLFIGAFFLWKVRCFGFSTFYIAMLICIPLAIWQLCFLPITRVQKILNDPEVIAKLQEAADRALEEFASYNHWKIVLFLSLPLKSMLRNSRKSRKKLSISNLRSNVKSLIPLMRVFCLPSIPPLLSQENRRLCCAIRRLCSSVSTKSKASIPENFLTKTILLLIN